MKGFIILLRRELMTYFISPVAYILFVFFHVLMGFSVWYLVNLLIKEQTAISLVLPEVFGSIFFWLANLLVVPPLTMRVFAEEKKEGTLETLMTAPVTDWQVVSAKFFGAYILYLFLWMPTLAYGPMLAASSANQFRPDPGGLVAIYTGVAGLGALFVAIGVLCSSFTRNQVVAAIMSFTLIALVFLVGFLPYVSPIQWVVDVSSYFSLVQHMDDFRRGAIDSRPLTLYASTVVVLLFATARSLEMRRWR